ncbi:MAG: Gfo/Idh/MocA family oxidoreductase [Ferruginibacter sp.]|nr:Gfo/Idh/MocA family oxidoreductase [Ferruginibacter sp.]
MSPIKTALLSFGMSGKVFHAPFLQVHPGFELAGAWERNTKTIGEWYPGVTSYPSLETLLADDSVDLVIVNTPTLTHYEYARQALLAGKDIIVEKAFTTTVAEAVDLKNIAAKVNKKISVYQNRRWDSDFKTVKKIIAEGWLGDINEAEIHYERFKPQLSPKQHKEVKSAGSGLLKDLGPHIIDSALCLFGFPQALFADIRITRQDSVVDDWFDILLYYKNLRVRLKSGLLVREALPGFIIHGSKGSFLKSRTDVQETDLQAGKVPNKTDWGTEPDSDQGLLHTGQEGNIIREKIKSLQGNYYDYYDGVYKALREDKPMPVTVDDGINIMRIIESAIQSCNEKKLITL